MGKSKLGLERAKMQVLGLLSPSNNRNCGLTIRSLRTTIKTKDIMSANGSYENVADVLQAALEQLAQEGYTEKSIDASYKSEVWKVTQRGYEYYTSTLSQVVDS